MLNKVTYLLMFASQSARFEEIFLQDLKIFVENGTTFLAVVLTYVA